MERADLTSQGRNFRRGGLPRGRLSRGTLTQFLYSIKE
jgi:hypothetical protein